MDNHADVAGGSGEPRAGAHGAGADWVTGRGLE
jgi:hypothetical protein